MNTAEYNFLEKNYDIGKIKDIKSVTLGVFSENNFVLTDKNNFFLKKNRDEIAIEIEKIEFIEDFFYEGNIPVILPIKTIDGKKHIKTVSGCFTLYPFINEKIIEEKDLSNENIYALGVLLAQMHKYSSENKEKYAKENILKDDWNKDKSLSKLTEIKNLILSQKTTLETKKYIDIIDIKIKNIVKEKITYDSLDIDDYALLHGDFHYGNIFFNENNEITSIFDFEKQKVGSMSGELSRAIMLICFNNSYDKSNFDRVEYFLKGYLTIRKITKEELEKGLTVYVTKLFFSYWFENEKFNKKNNRLKNLYEETSKSIRYLSKNKDAFIKKIISTFSSV